ncbi:bola-like protein [Xylaria bambusicola]|uniref:bola-like protein n=1 Tax=Xylaria bambusicola TaxID=326684 RepID=UPI002007B8E9|nr:bola-like protein [Xylaria bambusicola]KAI0527976.1 bola-like protein [Xylaria bambusicola]
MASRRCGTAALWCASRVALRSPTTRLPLHVQARDLLSRQPARAVKYPSALRYSTASSTSTEATNQPNTTLPEKPDYLNDAESAIWDKLAAKFSPTELMVQDISGGCGSMYGIEITSEKFRGVNMLKQQRMVNAVLGDEMKSWHGVQLRTKAP